MGSRGKYLRNRESDIMSAFNFRFDSSSAACDPEFCRHLRFVLLLSDMDGYLSHDHTTQQHLISVIVGDEYLLSNALNVV